MWLTIAALCGALAVIAGAFGAHGLQARATPEQLSAWVTASQYHLLHSVVLLALALYARTAQRSVDLQAGLILAGTVLFAGSIYLLVLTGQRWLGPITPLGGLLLIGGWGSLLLLARS